MIYEKLNYINTFSRMESDCTFRLGFKRLMNNISYTKQSKLSLHFFRTRNYLIHTYLWSLQGRSHAGCNSVFIWMMSVVCGLLRFREVPACTQPGITCIAQVTLKTMYNTFLLYDPGLFSPVLRALLPLYDLKTQVGWLSLPWGWGLDHI